MPMTKHNTSDHRHQRQRNWAEVLCFACTCLQLSWRRVVFRKWLNISPLDSDFSADAESDSDSDEEFCEWARQSRFRSVEPDGLRADPNGILPRLRRRKSETFRAQYINTKEIRICAATWNVGGKFPPDDLDDWLDTDHPADIYVIGFQEIVPLNACYIFGAEDSRTISVWENLIRETLSRVPAINKFRSFSDPPSPSKFKPSKDAPDIEDEFILESDSDVEEELNPLKDESNVFEENKDKMAKAENLVADPPVFNENIELSSSVDQESQRQFTSSKTVDRLNCLGIEDSEEQSESTNTRHVNKLIRTLSETERIGLTWPEPPLHLLPQHGSERPDSLKSLEAFTATKSYRTCGSVKSSKIADSRVLSKLVSLAEQDLKSMINRKRRHPYVRIVSKQMVGIFITIWVRRSLRRHIKNLNVSNVGVGFMGYMGTKGAISVRMSIHQTLFCFVCTHLTAGEREADAFKRNTDVQEIHRRTQFNSLMDLGLPKNIYDHERIIWLGDLNYRINLPYEQTRELISNKEWSILAEQDQLIKELGKGRAFDRWSEGALSFAPTYKYEFNSDTYFGQDPKTGRRTPAWCDRILSFGPGIKLLSYRRSELKLSDHRPVTASYSVEVEVFSPRKLQRALTFTDAEIEGQNITT